MLRTKPLENPHKLLSRNSLIPLFYPYSRKNVIGLARSGACDTKHRCVSLRLPSIPRWRGSCGQAGISQHRSPYSGCASAFGCYGKSSCSHSRRARTVLRLPRPPASASRCWTGSRWYRPESKCYDSESPDHGSKAGWSYSGCSGILPTAHAAVLPGLFQPYLPLFF